MPEPPRRKPSMVGVNVALLERELGGIVYQLHAGHLGAAEKADLETRKAGLLAALAVEHAKQAGRGS